MRLPGIVIQCERLSLRELGLHDADFILRLLNEPGFLRFIGDKGVRTLDDAREYLIKGPLESYRRHGFGLYLVSLRADGTPIGMCGLVKRDSLVDPDVASLFWRRIGPKGMPRKRRLLSWRTAVTRWALRGSLPSPPSTTRVPSPCSRRSG